MITNINTLQNLPQSEHLQTYSDIYLKQSLSNLGQRFSIKGDGVQVGEFSISEFFSEVYDKDKHASTYVLASIDNELVDADLQKYATTVSITKIDGDTRGETIPLDGNSYYLTVEDLQLPGTIIGGVHHYASGGVISKKDNEFVTLFTGKTSDHRYVEITCDDFSINTNENSERIKEGIRFFVSNIDGKVIGVHLFTDTKQNNQYKADVYDSVLSSLSDLETNISALGLDYSDITPSELINHLAANNIISARYANSVLAYKGLYQEIETFRADWASLGISQKQINEYDQVTVLFSEDENKFLPFIEEYYNSYVFFGPGTNLELKKRIFVSIVKQIYKDYVSVDALVDKLELFLPFNYKFVYRCNSNDPSIIYNSVNDISIEYTDDVVNELYKLLGDNAEQMIICNGDAEINLEERFGVYHYSVTYIKDHIVDDIVVTKKYTLPYIDRNGYWCINDIPTSIYARGKDGGQPNIIMMHTDMSSPNAKPTILSSFKEDEINQLDWQEVEYYVRPLDSSDNVGEQFYHVMKTFMPIHIEDKHENLVQFLESAVILNVNSVKSEIVAKSTAQNTLEENLGEQGVIPTFWVLQKVKNELSLGTDENQYKYVFEYVKQPGQENSAHPWAIDINYLSNAEGIVKHYMNFGIEPDNYEHTWLVFDKISTSFKNSTTDSNVSVWPVFRNQKRVDFTDQFGAAGGTSTQYTNDLNLVIGFYDNVTKTNGTGYINGVNQFDGKKYLSIDANSHSIGAVINYSYYPQEYIPNAVVDTASQNPSLIPTLDLKEVFVRNENVLNRLNIISTDSEKHIYNAYFGTAYDSIRKNILHIGTSSRNINVGNTTLLNRNNNNDFGKFTEFDIDFDEVYINGNIHVKGGNWASWQNINGSQYNMTTPVSYIGRVYSKTGDGQINFEEAKKHLLSTYNYISMPAFKIQDTNVPACQETVSLLNLSFYLENYSGMAGFSKDSCIVGDSNHLIYDTATSTYYLILTTNVIDDDTILYKTSDNNVLRHVITNPIQFSYMIDGSGKQHINVRELITDISSIVNFNVNKIVK